MICHGAMKSFISQVRTYCSSNLIRGWTSNWWGTCLAWSIFLKQYLAAEMKHSAFEGAFHSTKTFKNLETESNGTEIPRKSFRNSGNCWISEMAETLNRKTPGAKLNGKKTSGKKDTSYSKPIPRIVCLARLISFLEILENAAPFATGSCWKFKPDVLVEWKAPVVLFSRKFAFHFFQAISQAFAAVFR